MQQKNTITKLPKSIIVALVAVCGLPFLLQILGVDFSKEIIASQDNTTFNEQLHNISGAFLHIILEWSAILVAIITAVFAILQFNFTKNETTPILAVALLCAASSDAFHALASAQLIKSVAPTENFIPFSWALARMYTVLILLIGVSISLFRRKNSSNKKHSPKFIYWTSFGFIAISFVTLYICANTKQLPETMFPNEFIKRPYDIVPLILYTAVGIFLFPKFYKHNQSVFAHALQWSILPVVVTQLHMAFGSDHLFDAHFNIGHTLKVVFYLVPFTGITLDYLITYKEKRRQLKAIYQTNVELEQKNAELKQLTYITSHDLQEPLRVITSFSELIQDEHINEFTETTQLYLNFISKSTARMQELVKALMDHSLIGSEAIKGHISCNDVVREIKLNLTNQLKEEAPEITAHNLPEIWGCKKEIVLLFDSLISNAIKFSKANQKAIIDIRGKATQFGWEFEIADNGIGIEPKYFDRIFTIFQRLHTQNEYPGSGIGLSHCKKIVELHQGKIWVEKSNASGSTFKFFIHK